MSLTELLIMFAFFPMWGIFACILGALAMGMGAVFRRFPIIVNSAIPFGALMLAMAASAWLNCALVISLPFASPTCKFLGF